MKYVLVEAQWDMNLLRQKLVELLQGAYPHEALRSPEDITSGETEGIVEMLLEAADNVRYDGRRQWKKTVFALPQHGDSSEELEQQGLERLCPIAPTYSQFIMLRILGLMGIEVWVLKTRNTVASKAPKNRLKK